MANKKGNIFTKEEVEATSDPALANILRTMRVDDDGSVSFKTNVGRGSGTPVTIPADAFDEFIDVLQNTRNRQSNEEDTEA